jgi:ADP-ribosylglycohydrolase
MERNQMKLYDRALGSLLGLFVGDAFGAQTEFMREETVAKYYPLGIHEMNTKNRQVGTSGEITDDSEMAIMLAMSIIKRRGFITEDVKNSYVSWMNAGPLDIGITISNALRNDDINPNSQANGALMRVAPLAIFGSKLDERFLISLSDSVCAITHSHSLCKDINRIWTWAIAKTIREGETKEELYKQIVAIAPKLTDNTLLLSTIEEAKTTPPATCDEWNMGWVLIAFHLALYSILNYETFEEGLKAITLRAGDADTNAAIYGMLAGAIYGVGEIPSRWVKALKPTQVIKTLLQDRQLEMDSLAKDLVKSLILCV